MSDVGISQRYLVVMDPTFVSWYRWFPFDLLLRVVTAGH